MTSSSSYKRARLSASSPDDLQPFHHASDSPPTLTPHSSSFSSASQSNVASSSSFRNVSACNRCRVRKNRCDQNLPACSPCEKVGVKCTGFDPITKREIPRTYVYYLESRVKYLEGLLASHDIKFGSPEEFDLGATPILDNSSSRGPVDGDHRVSRDGQTTLTKAKVDFKPNEVEKLDKLVSNIGMVSVQGTSDPRFLGSTSGISFARVVLAAVKSSLPNASSSKSNAAKTRQVAKAPTTSAPSMRDSFFGLQSRPTINPAPLPDEDIGKRLVELYFEHANPQIPILHRGEFMTLFARAYRAKVKSSRELYMMNIVFAIGAGIIYEDKRRTTSTGSTVERPEVPNEQKQPEEYHSAAMQHLESFLGSTPVTDQSGFGGGLEELQAVLLLAGFALLRPVGE
ncbi:MAG: hypothetical protein Q9191_001552 [Dirinaria sp. TL-2023a]